MTASHTLSCTLLTNDVDAFGLWRPNAMFSLMQQSAGEHSAELGFSRETLVEQLGYVWMIARAQSVIHRMPKHLDTIHVTTWYGEPNKITFPRYFKIHDDNGALVASASTAWTLVDLSSRRIVPPGKCGLVFPPEARLTSELPEPGKLRLKKEGVPVTACRAPLYSDIDVNGHMNNANYVSWIMDLFPMEHHRAFRLHAFSIGYLSEAVPGEQVQLSLYRYGNAFEVQGTDRTDGHAVFEAQGEWLPVQAD
ncbi:MAG TPA: acyl-ACP thioesterase domain-containing protein [Feifaniaceae bacterium]|nr:acyl-ACP thioesterase domain-containing protein [Feifaniaceae bacterium]